MIAEAGSRPIHAPEAPIAAATDQTFPPLLAALCAEAGDAAPQVEAEAGPYALWIYARHRQGAVPAQGWKLHVSAGPRTAEHILRRAIPVLLAERAPFKIAGSAARLAALNLGEFGPTQVGKFITVYPCDDAQAVRLARALDEAIGPIPAPAVPTDRPLVAGSPVHYRYGGMGGRLLQGPDGALTPAIAAPNGSPEEDRRTLGYTPPAWALDPFVAAGVAGELPPDPTPGLVAGRYLIVSTLQRAPRGAVHLAVDLAERRRCILKQSVRAVLRDLEPPVADPAGHEARILAALADDGRYPKPYGIVEHAGDPYLVMEDLGGESLAEHLATRASQGQPPPDHAQIVAWGCEIAEALGALHALGQVHRDLKAANMILGDDGHLRLIDLEMAHPVGDPSPARGHGTRGHISPQQAAGMPPAATDDIYGLGALLYLLGTQAEPALAPDPAHLLARPPRLLNPTLSPDLDRVIRRSLDPMPERRYASTAAAAAALRAAREYHVEVSQVPEPVGLLPRDWSDAARRLGDTLCREAVPAPSGGLRWLSRHTIAGGIAARDINTGAAGALLALAELVIAFDLPAHRRAIAAGAQGLLGAPRPDGPPLAGLLVGEAGIAAALLRCGQALRDDALIEAAAARGRLIAALPHASPDLFNGTAGRLLLHLLLWDATGAPDQLGAATAAGLALVDRACPAEGGGAYWAFPPEYGGLCKGRYLGYAHGAAGIGDALLDLYEATGDGRILGCALRAARWLSAQARPVPGDDAPLAWPAQEGEGPSAAFWCHGAAGVGRIFGHAAALGVFEGAERLARGAARDTARSTRWANPTQCHGLAGNIEFLLDRYQATGQPDYLRDARELGHLLDAQAVEREGHLFWPSELPTTFSPDYMVGYAGVAVTLLRLADPGARPRQLSRRGFALRARGSDRPAAV